MNNLCYRVVFNENLGAWVAVDETVRARGKRSRGRVRRMAALLAALGVAGVVEAQTVRLPVESTAAVRTATNFGTYSLDRSVANQLTINQGSASAIINWDSFNIDRGGKVQFVQPDANSRALNRIWDADPSQINGVLSANGQVYLINRNGIRFGADAQVDVGGLVASALNIHPDVFKSGFLSQSGKGAAFYYAGRLDDVTGEVVDFDTPNASAGSTPAQVSNVGSLRASEGGSIMLFAPQVENSGRIETTSGQVVLAAGSKVYLSESGNTALRGLLVEVDPFAGGDASSSSVSNTGLKDQLKGIIANRGNITLAAMAVNNDGLLKVTSGKTENGSIYLQGRHTTSMIERGNTSATAAAQIKRQALATQGGTVVTGANSRIEAEIESVSEAEVVAKAAKQFVADPADSAAVQQSKLKALQDLIRKQYTVSASDTLKPSEIVIDARTVTLASGSQISAPAGRVSIGAAGERVYGANQEAVETYLSVAAADTGASVSMESGASIDVAGYRGVQVDGARNQISATLVSNELKDAPLQRNGVLYRQTVSFSRLDDADGKLAVADASGSVNNLQTSLRERAANAGSVKIQSTGDVNISAGAKIDVSGGSVNYSEADIVTTRLTAGSLRVDIDKASADIVYDGISSESRHVAAYTEGKDAGSVTVAARGKVDLAGELRGETLSGLYQTSSSTAAKGGGVTLETGRALLVGDGLASTGSSNAVSVNRLTAAGFRNFSLYGDSITLDAASPVQLAAGSSLALNAINDLDLNADVRGAGMKFSAVSSLGTVRLGAGRVLDASGMWINDWLSLRNGQSSFAGLRQTDGGSVTLQAAGGVFRPEARVELGTGSRIDVSGGGSLSSSGSFKAGNAGSIALNGSAGVDLADAGLRGEALALGTASGKGGTLSISAPGIRIDEAAQDAGDLVLDAARLRTGGFAKIALTASYTNASIAAGSNLALARSVRQLGGNWRQAATGSSLSRLGSSGKLDASLKDPVSFSLAATYQDKSTMGFYYGVLEVGAGARINVGTGGSISLAAGRQLTLEGELLAAGGTVALGMAKPDGSQDPGYFDDQSILLGETARIDVAGKALVQTSARGVRSGEVLDGGSVRITAGKGYIVAQEGARINLDGSSAMLDQSDGKDVMVASDAGSLSLESPVGMLFGAQVSAKAGGAGAAGGNFSVQLLRDTEYLNGEARDLAVGEDLLEKDPALRASLAAVAGRASLQPVFAGKTQAWVDSKALEQAGFDNVSLRSADRMAFAGTVGLDAARQIALAARTFDVSSADVSLRAAVVRLGSDNYVDDKSKQDTEKLFTGVPAAGDGRLNIEADYIGLWGGSQVTGASQTRLASRGELTVSTLGPEGRLRSGIFAVGGNLDIEAAQISPTTFSDFTVRVAPEADGAGGVLSIRGTGNVPQAPLSAAGRLVLEADTINQGGVLRAPFGTLELNARKELNLLAGSLSSASGEGLVVPYGVLVNGKDWTISPGGSDQIISAAPVPVVALRAPSVVQQAGATVDVSGGGDLQALEWVPGSGGSTNVLEQANTYAIVPGYASAYAPESAGFDRALGTQITLGAEAGVPAGTYTLLPARYAMLPGAYKVTLLSGYANAADSLQIRQALGGTVVSGRLSVANTTVADSQNLGVLVESREITQQRSEFTEALASSFFEKKAEAAGSGLAHATADAGQLILAASERIRLEGSVDMAAFDDGSDKRRRGGLLDIGLLKSSLDAEGKPTGSLVVGDGESSAEGLKLKAQDIAAIGAESVLIGGERTVSATGAQISVTAKNLSYASASGLQSATGDKPAEVILAASDTLTVAANSRIEAAAVDAGRPASLQGRVSGDGALLRVAADANVVQRTGVSAVPERGTLIVETGTQLIGASVQADATLDSRLARDSAASAQSFTLGANAISLGSGAAGSGGTRLDGDLLASVAGSAGQITLRSYTGIRFDESFTLGSDSPVKQLTLDGPSLEWAGSGAGTVDIRANSLTLTNTTGGSATASAGEGVLRLSAEGGGEAGVLEIASGDMALRGFGDTSLTASRGVQFSGSGTTTARGTVQVDTPMVTVASAANHALVTDGAMTLAPGKAGGEALAAGAGGILRLEAAAATVGTQIASRSGSVGIKAGSGDLVLGDGARIDVSSRETLFGTTSVTTNAGRVVLEATQGDIKLQTGSEIDLRGRGDSSAGSLTLAAPKGEVTLAGSLTATAGSTAASDGSAAGKLNVDAGHIADVNALIRGTQEFEAQRILRQRAGDMAINETLKAQMIGLYADAGNIRVDSKLDARGPSGGRIDIAAQAAVVTQPDGSAAVQGGRIVLGSNALLDASATAEGGTGGSVTLSASGAAAETVEGVTLKPQEQAEIVFEAGSQINVSGKGSGADGSVTLNAPRRTDLAAYNPVLGSIATVGEASIFTAPPSATTAELAPLVAGLTNSLPLSGSNSSSLNVSDAGLPTVTRPADGVLVDLVMEASNTVASFTGISGKVTVLSVNGSTARTVRTAASTSAAANVLRAGGSYRLKYVRGSSSTGANDYWLVVTSVTPVASPSAVSASNAVTLLSLAGGFAQADGEIVYFTPQTSNFGGSGANLGSGGVKIRTANGSALSLNDADNARIGAGGLVAGTAYAAKYNAASGSFTLLSSTGSHETLRIASSTITGTPAESLAIQITVQSTNTSNNVELQLNGLAAGRLYAADGLTPVAAGALAAGKTYSISRLSDGRYALRPAEGFARIGVTAANAAMVGFSLDTLAGSGNLAVKLAVNGGAALQLLDASGAALGSGDLQAGKTYVAALVDGSYRLLADDALDNSVAVINHGVLLSGSPEVKLNAMKTYAAKNLDAGLRNQVQAEAQQYAYWLPTITGQLGSLDKGKLLVRTGVEIRSAGDLKLTEDWNLANWRNGEQAAAGSLTIRAAGNLELAASINDGFATVTSSQPGSAPDGWDLALVAGADLSAASRMAIQTTSTASLNVSKKVRTGAGDIALAAAGDIDLSASSASVYSGGARITQAASDMALQSSAGKLWLTQGGGDVSFTAGGDILGRAVSSSPTNWLWRTAASKASAEQAAATGVNYAQFDWVTGALGGGNVSLDAGGSVRDMSVALPAQTQFVFGENGKASGTVPLTGGNLAVRAGQDILGGSYLVENGQANFDAGAALRAGSTETRLFLADTRAAVNVGGELALGSVQNASMLNLSDANSPASTVGDRARWVSLSSSSALALRSAAGGVRLSGKDSVLPASLEAVALGDDISLGGTNELAMQPSANGQLALYAEGSVRGTTLSMIDADPASLPSALAPIIGNDPASATKTRTDAGFRRDSTLFSDNGEQAYGVRSTASTQVGSLHEGDAQAAQIHARSGDVSGSFIVAKAVELSTGQDVKDLTLIAQNLTDRDVSSVSAGRDVVYSTIPAATLKALPLQTAALKIFGPGQLAVTAGRNVDLANAGGIVSKGAGVNSYLPETGASIRVVAGQPTSIDAAAFAAAYLDATQATAFLAMTETAQLAYAADVLRERFRTTYLGEGSTHAAAWQAWVAQHGDSAASFQRFRYELLWAELSASGQAAAAIIADAKANPGKYSGAELAPEKLYARGFQALELMGLSVPFGFNSSVRMLFSQIRSQSGGNVDVLVPGGSLEIGPTQMAGVPVSKQGLVANQGDSRVFVRDAINVNTSRWFAIDGGNILGWASNGDIDAGKGSRTAVSGSSQRLDVDALTGKVSLVDGGASTGSGIASIFNKPITEGGNVELYAVRGAINAGEAGIRAAGNVSFSGNVIGGDFIMVVGGGAPAAPPAVGGMAIAPPASDNNAGRTVSEAEPTASGGKPTERSSVLTVEVVAGGDVNALPPTGAGAAEDCSETDKAGARCKPAAPRKGAS